MRNSTGLRNFAENIRPIMAKIHQNINPYGTSKKFILSPEEMNTVKEFYNEVVFVLAQNTEKEA